MKKRMKRFKNRRTTSTAAILCMAALLFAVLLAGCSVQKETEASGDQQQETWSEEMENSTALSEKQLPPLAKPGILPAALASA